MLRDLRTPDISLMVISCLKCEEMLTVVNDEIELEAFKPRKCTLVQLKLHGASQL